MPTAKPTFSAVGRPLTRWRIARRTSVVLVTAALLSALFPARPEAATPALRPAGLQRDADALHRAGVTGVSVRLETPRGVRTARSGTGDLGTGRPVPRNGYVRIGSTTKTFVATVLLQLAGEGRLSLDDTVDRWLPGVVRGHGNDGRRITLRRLLQHTSGLPDYIGEVAPHPTAAEYRRNRWTAHTSAQRVALAMKHPPAFEPGARWQYSNTNYVLAGMVIKAVTGRSWEDEVRGRILRPLRLTHTRAPGDRPFLPGPHASDYQQFAPHGPLTDTTIAYLPFDGDADGSLISTTADTNTFFRALLHGELLAPAQLADMQHTVEEPDGHGTPPGTRYGLGLEWTPLSCGGGYWGHSGDGYGYLVWPATTPDGRATVTVSVHSRPGDPGTATRQIRGITGLVDHALCTVRTEGRP
ncbi:serine hydrolase domain-containing protein [Streptomyces sp. GS7]|uniref:serine hydrolase domain-containing protein n=1 Tax=Streptomyces sp. GS7 TaxID=2692234 RepID=UPI001318F7B8|nr:serine hydrolase domain-containing protein [Streptomyces sp. GS7]QHC23131.1 serine hydrolase [Streptomyces sp. GS7]